MVSAPPLIAFEYNHKVDKDSEEEKLMHILKEPRDWLSD
jgi:coproporphyrinogen III oxidase